MTLRRTRTAAGASAAALIVLLGSGAGAFGEAGHRIVGHAAEIHLRGTRALDEVRRILPPQETLADASVWPDTVKDPLYDDEDAGAFRLEHPAHDVYHYTNVPFQAERYDPDAPGAHWADIVRMTSECIRVLQGASHTFTPRQALRLLAHFAGDIHQPLHVGTGYIPAGGSLTFIAPAGPTGWRVTLGGNALRYGPGDRFNLHAYWDTHAVNLAVQKKEPAAYAADLVRQVTERGAWRSAGPVQTWPAQWATDALTAAKQVHRGIRITQYLGPDDERRTAHRWRIHQPAGYDDVARDLVPVQLAKAGFRLAATLGAIWPEGQ